MQTGSESAAASLPAMPESTSPEMDRVRKGYILGVVNTSHFLNHLQNGSSAVLMPLMMQALGFNYVQLGLIASLNQVAGAGMQVIYGVLAQYYRRSVLLGIANIMLGSFNAGLGLTQTFTQVLIVRVIAGLGSSAQHPLGATTLSSFFRKTRGQMLGIHTTTGNIGSLVAPIVVVALLRFLDWRTVFMVVAIPSVVMGFLYFFAFGDVVSRKSDSKKSGTKMALSSYLACLKNREVMVVSAIQMVGAAGRGTDINQVFFVPFFMAWMGVDMAVAALLLALLQFGGVLGPVGIGWISDRTSRRWTIFGTLFLSTVSTITLLLHSQVSIALFLNLLVYGAVVQSRETLTQSMISDAVPEEHADAAFSLYFFIGFISGPAWTALTGYLVETSGFGMAFLVVGLTYLNGIWLIGLLSPRKKATARGAG
ncbi:MAG: MFS transporter [Chloroflexi bacterium]|nr:MFS transporter [Chloroflexota bacterium]